MRLLFVGKPGSPFSVMTSSFALLSPMLVGAITVYVAERRQRRRWEYYFVAPLFANVFYVLGTLLILIEEMICAIVILPLFAAIGALGGLAMGAVCRAPTGRSRRCWALRSFRSFSLRSNVACPCHSASPPWSVR